MNAPIDLRPAAAVGHVSLRASSVPSATARLEAIGLRPIVTRDSFAVIEMRGGTHIVLRQSSAEDVFDAPFDLMYDDIDAAHARLAEAGFEIGAISRGRIHHGFTATAPEGFRIEVTSSHAGKRPV